MVQNRIDANPQTIANIHISIADLIVNAGISGILYISEVSPKWAAIYLAIKEDITQGTNAA